MNYIDHTPWMDLSHFNIRMYEKEFVGTALAKKYSKRSWNEFAHAKEIHENIKCVLVDELSNTMLSEMELKFSDVIYVNGKDEVIKLN